VTQLRDVIEVYPDKNGQYRWRRKAANGRILSVGAEPFDSKANALRAARRAAEPVDDDDGDA